MSPGGIFDNQNPVFVENYSKIVPLRRMGDPAEIAPSVIFLLSSRPLKTYIIHIHTAFEDKYS